MQKASWEHKKRQQANIPSVKPYVAYCFSNLVTLEKGIK
jgi:hypothetical protein